MPIFETNNETGRTGENGGTSLTGKHANWNSTRELTYSDQTSSRRGKMTRAFRRWGEWSVFRRVRATELRRVLLRTIYDSNRRYSRRPTVNAKYTLCAWARCDTAWQIQSKLHYAHSGFVTRCIVCRHLGPPLRRLPVPFAFFSALAPLPHRDFESWQPFSASWLATSHK